MKFRYNDVILMGDTHGTLPIKKALLDKVPEYNDVFHVGDVGIGFHEYSLTVESIKELNNICHEKDIDLFLLRGNHDNPAWWDTPLKLELSRVFFVNDYTTILFPNGKSALCVGGSISVDRCYRNKNIDYWIREATPYPRDILNKHDYIFAHDCPSFINHSTESVEKTFPSFVEKDKLLLDDLKKQREIMDYVVDKVRPKEYYYGHYHNSELQEHNGCSYRCLNINELKELKV